MPLCGFNQKMLEGLTAFSEGLAEHGLLHRSAINGETLDQAIKREIADMTRLFLELDRIDDRAKRLLTEGIAKYAMGFYLILRECDEESVKQHYRDIIENVGKYFFEMDEMYYGELEGKPKDMAQLAEHLNGIHVS